MKSVPLSLRYIYICSIFEPIPKNITAKNDHKYLCVVDGTLSKLNK